MRVTTSKSKNAESFYISKGYVNDKGVSTSVIVRKLGTLNDLLVEHGPTRDDVMAWAKEKLLWKPKNTKRKSRAGLSRSLFMETGRLTITNRFFIVEDIFFSSTYITPSA